MIYGKFSRHILSFMQFSAIREMISTCFSYLSLSDSFDRLRERTLPVVELVEIIVYELIVS